MRRFLLSERNLVVVLFVMVVVIFSFAQADTSKIEKMYFDTGVPVTISPDPSPKAKVYTENEKPAEADAVNTLR